MVSLVNFFAYTIKFVEFIGEYSDIFKQLRVLHSNSTFRTDLDLCQAKLGLCTTKDETELLTGCLNSVWPHSIVHVSLLVCPLCCVLALVCIFGVTPQRALDVVLRGCDISLQGSFLLVPVCLG